MDKLYWLKGLFNSKKFCVMLAVVLTAMISSAYLKVLDTNKSIDIKEQAMIALQERDYINAESLLEEYLAYAPADEETSFILQGVYIYNEAIALYESSKYHDAMNKINELDTEIARYDIIEDIYILIDDIKVKLQEQVSN